MAKIKYNGETLAEIKAGQSITLHTDGHELDGDLVIEGFNGGGSSNCDGCIIEVDTLPTEGIDEKALYKVGDSYYKCGDKELKDVVMLTNGALVSVLDEFKAMNATIELYYVDTKPTENIRELDEATFIIPFYYVAYDDDIFLYTEGEWIPLSLMFEVPNGGAIADASEATTEGHYYALIGGGWTEYRVAPDGTLNITDNGTFDVTEVASVNVNIAGVCGIWRFNETVEKGFVDLTQNVNFTTYIEGKVYECTGMWVSASNYSDPTHLEYHGDGVPSVYRGGGDTWLYDSARTVNYGAEPQAVHPDYKTWLTNNATRIDEAYELSGKYIFNDTVTNPSVLDLEQDINFTSGEGAKCIKMGIYVYDDGTEIEYYFADGQSNIRYDSSTGVYWANNNAKIIDFGDVPQTVSKDYYDWVLANAKPASSLPIEISTEAEMTALLESAEVGSVYKYVGTTDTYENGGLYIVEAVSE